MRLKPHILLPAIYVFLEVGLFAGCFATIGHGDVCAYAYYLLFPAAFVVPEIYVIGLLLSFALNILLYAVIGWLLETFLLGQKRKKL